LKIIHKKQQVDVIHTNITTSSISYNLEQWLCFKPLCTCLYRTCTNLQVCIISVQVFF